MHVIVRLVKGDVGGTGLPGTVVVDVPLVAATGLVEVVTRPRQGCVSRAGLRGHPSAPSALPGRTSKKKSNVEPASPLPDGNVLLLVVKVPLMPAPLASVTWVLPGVPNELPVVAMANTYLLFPSALARVH